MPHLHSTYEESGIITHLAANTPRIQFNRKIPNGVQRVELYFKVTLAGTGLGTTNKITGEVFPNISISADQAPKLVDSNGEMLLKRLQADAKGALQAISAIDTLHELTNLYVIDAFLDENGLDLGIGKDYSRVYFDIQLANTTVACPDVSNWTGITLQTEYKIIVHFDEECADDVGYRQYIGDYFPINVEHSYKTITRPLQSNRIIDSILINNPLVTVKKVTIVRDTNEILYEADFEMAKLCTNRVANVSGNLALMDPPEFLDTKSDCALVLELGEVTAASQINFLTEYIYSKTEEKK
ncbi:MAG: hypothetical protein ACTSWW_13490 [Promethearchaeota archaeon]